MPPLPQHLDRPRRDFLRTAAAVLVLPAVPALAQSALMQVSADSSLTDVLPLLAQAFEPGRPGMKLQLGFGASLSLVDALGRRGAGVATDVVLSADDLSITRGVERRLLRPETVRGFASNALVLVVPAGSRLGIQRLTDLRNVEVQRIAMGRQPHAPDGRYARESLNAARLWPSVQRKIVTTDDVRQTLQRVVDGDVDAAFVYRTDALVAGNALRVVETLGGHSPIRYTAAVAAGSTQAEAAEAFVNFLRTDAARAVLVRAGFAAL